MHSVTRRRRHCDSHCSNIVFSKNKIITISEIVTSDERASDDECRVADVENRTIAFNMFIDFRSDSNAHDSIDRYKHRCL